MLKSMIINFIRIEGLVPPKQHGGTRRVSDDNGRQGERAFTACSSGFMHTLVAAKGVTDQIKGDIHEIYDHSRDQRRGTLHHEVHTSASPTPGPAANSA